MLKRKYRLLSLLFVLSLSAAVLVARGVTAEAVGAEHAQQSGGTGAQWIEVSNAAQVSDWISAHWSDEYFQKAVVTPKQNWVTVDGEQCRFTDVFGDLDEKSSSVLRTSKSIEAFFEETAYQTETQLNGTVVVTAPYQTMRVVVTAEELDKDYGADQILVYPEYQEYILQFSTEEDTQLAYEQLVKQYGSEHCYVDQILDAEEVLQETESETEGTWGAAYMGLDTLKTKVPEDAPVITVAILDTGIDADHTWFEGRTISADSRNLADENQEEDISDVKGHGTHVAGIVTTCTPDNVELLILRVFNEEQKSSLTILSNAIQYALEKDADIINMSVGVVTEKAQSALDTALDAATQANVVVCCAAGNTEDDVAKVYPACDERTLAISAIDKNGEFAESYSSYGDEIDFCAPGSKVSSAQNGGGVKVSSGTSMACPHVSSALAYLKMKDPDITNAKLYEEAKRYATDLGEAGKDIYYGWGCLHLDDLSYDTWHDFDDGLSWSMDEAGNLSIKGEGSVQTAPWTESEIAVSSLTLEDGITSVGDSVFANCTELKAVNLGNTVEAIGSKAFAGCTSLTEVTIPSSVQEIGSEAFSGCSSLETVNFAQMEQVQISADAFSNTPWGENLLSHCNITLIDSVVYTGEEQTPEVTVQYGSATLMEGTDYTVSYVDNINAGTASVTVTGMGDYTGTVTRTFTISKAANEITASDFTKNASASATQTFSIEAKAKGGTLSYESDQTSVTVSSSGKVTIAKNYAGKATITITAEDSNYETAVKSITVTVNQISGKITASDFKKTTKTVAQSFSIGAKCAGNGKLTYSSNQKYVTVSSKGKVTIAKNFVGKATITIKAASSGIYKATSKKITVTVNPAGVSLSSVSNGKGKKMTIKWKKNSRVTGYRIQYSTDKSFKKGVKTVTVSKASTTSKTVSGLTKGKSYYVRVSTYKTVSGTKYYSGWSSSKSVKIKR